MTEPVEQQPKRERSLLGFYIAMGVLAAMVVLGVWLWTPLRIWYWERELRDPTIRNQTEGVSDSEQVLGSGHRGQVSNNE